MVVDSWIELRKFTNQQILEPVFKIDWFRDGLLELWICVNTLMQWISCVKVASNFLFRLSVRHVGQMNTQVWLLNSWVRWAGWVDSELVDSESNTERMMLSSIHNVEMPSKMSYLLFISSPCQNRRIAEYSLPQSQKLCLEITVFARITECLEIKLVSTVTWIFSLSIKFAVLRRRWKRNRVQTLPWPATCIPRNA